MSLKFNSCLCICVAESRIQRLMKELLSILLMALAIVRYSITYMEEFKDLSHEVRHTFENTVELTYCGRGLALEANFAQAKRFLDEVYELENVSYSLIEELEESFMSRFNLDHCQHQWESIELYEEKNSDIHPFYPNTTWRYSPERYR